MKEILISTGDPSAQLHAVKVAERLRRYGFRIVSVGGEKLKNISDDFLADTISLETFGFSLSLASLVKLYWIFRKVKMYMISRKPSAVLLVDFYGFNIKLAKLARALDMPVYYYIPPQIWASRYDRIKNIKKYVTKVFLTLPFEKEIYEKEKIDALYVGNPLLETLYPSAGPAARNEEIKVGFFPGSRSHIIKRHVGIINKTAALVRAKISSSEKLRFYLFGLKEIVGAYSGLNSDIEVIYGPDSGVKKSELDIAMSVSGTGATELALLKIPTIIFYKVSRLNAFIVKKLIRSKYVSLPNILLDEEVFPEYLQENATPQKLSDKIVEYIQNPNVLAVIRNKLDRVRSILAPENASEKVAETINGMLA